MVELYDLVGANDLRFSPYCWRTKAVLVYRSIPYTTVYIPSGPNGISLVGTVGR
jgi:hypothetical protein